MSAGTAEQRYRRFTREEGSAERIIDSVRGRRLAFVDRSFPAPRSLVDDEGLGGIAARGYAANGEADRPAAGVELDDLVLLEHQAAEQDRLAIGEAAVGQRPAPFVAMLAGFRNDDIMFGVRRRNEQLLLGRRRRRRGRSAGDEQGGENRAAHEYPPPD